MNIEEQIKGLNSRQQEAVLHDNSPLLVLAGAGSGKTKVLTHRIAYLLHKYKYKPSRILSVTFTNKAANEMKERVGKLVEDKGYFTYMGTFHSICVKILRRDGKNVGIEPSFTIYDDNDSKDIIKEIMRNMNIDVKQLTPNTVQWVISQAKNSMLEPHELQANNAEEQFGNRISDIYKEYQKIVEDRNAVDFNDIINKTIALFKKKEILNKYTDIFSHILIDEYQDTNKSQYLLIKQLAQDKGNITVVGDEDQSIYGWRGADIQNILSFERDFTHSKVVKLEQNYRSTQQILDAAFGIIQKNSSRREKRLWSDKTNGEQIKIYNALNEADEASFIAKEIKKEKYNYSDTAILIRANAQSRYLEEHLINSKIPYKLIGGTKFYDRKEIKDIVSYLISIQNPADLLSLNRVINTPPRKIGKQTVLKLLELKNKLGKRYTIPQLLAKISTVEAEVKHFNEAKKSKQKATGQDKNLENLLFSSDNNETSEQNLLDKNSEEEIINVILDSKLHKNPGIKEFANLVSSFYFDIENNQKTLSEFLISLVEKINYINFISDGTKESEFRVENIKELLSKAANYDDRSLKKAIRKFLEDVALIQNADDENKDNSVNIMTVHAAKGLEFQNVFLPGLEEGIFPHSRALLEEKEIEEERRLAYVAVTRAKENLYISFANSREYFGKIQNNEVSRFIEDIPSEVIHTLNLYSNLSNHDSITDTQQDVGDSTESYIDIGDAVSHPSFGTGTIKDIEHDIVVVAFDDAGEKRLFAQYANLSKL